MVGMTAGSLQSIHVNSTEQVSTMNRVMLTVAASLAALSIADAAEPPLKQELLGRGRPDVKSAELKQDPLFQQGRSGVIKMAELMQAPTMQKAEGFATTDNVKAIYFDALNWRGAPTKVFAWLGLPEKANGKIPGIVLVHGGGGTAFREWVQKWNEAGFAAISIAVEGQTDERMPGDAKRGFTWRRHAWPGPARVGIYGDSTKPLEDQWMYHAVADSILANSLLRSLPEVDANQVGIMGISWGGIITSTVMGIDNRLAFAIPVYGCGNLAKVPNQYGRALGDQDFYQQVWDPMIRIKHAKMPALWLSWPNDQHFPLDAQRACYQAMGGKFMVSLIPNMRHSHPAGWNPPDSYAFAESVVRTGRPWCEQTELTQQDLEITAAFSSTRPLDRAELVWTADSGITGDRTWNQSPATLKKLSNSTWRVTTTQPAATAWFINVYSGKLTVSSIPQFVH